MTCSSLRTPRSEKFLPERFVFDGIPAQPDTEAKATAGEEVDFGRLLCREHGLPLGQDDDASHQLETRDGGDIAEQHKRLMKRRVHVVGSGPILVDRGIRAYHVVVREQVGVAELLDAVGVGPNRADVATEFSLGKDHAYPHTGHAISVRIRSIRP